MITIRIRTRKNPRRATALNLLLCLTSALSIVSPSKAADLAPPRPNIVIILADDMGFSDLGCYGGEINTPNLDRLASEGLRFTQFYNTPRCSCSRACLLTGLWPHQADMGHLAEGANRGDMGLPGYHNNLSHDAVTLAEVLRGAGYATYMAGKWHLTAHTEVNDNWPLQRGFDRFYGFLPSNANYFHPALLYRGNDPVKPKDDPDYQPATYYTTDAFTDHAIRDIDEHRRNSPDKPFFLYLAFNAPHWPMQAFPEDIAKYKGKYSGGYDAIRQRRFARLKELGIINPRWELSPTDGDWDRPTVRNRGDAPVDKAWEQRCMEVYAGDVDRLDQNVGRLVEKLRSENALDNTLILFMSDNGGCAEAVGRKAGAPMPGPGDTFISYGQAWANVSNTPFRYWKHFVHEGGISTPFIAHWPRGIHRAGELQREPAHLIDIMSTCLELSGAAYPPQFNGHAIIPTEGVSLVGAFSGHELHRERPLCWEHEGNRAIHDGKYKLVAKGPDGKWQLYDMENDRTEMHDLAETQPQRVAAMTAEWEAWAKRCHVVPWPWKPPYLGEQETGDRRQKSEVDD
jgi:arylsulfatase